MSIEDVLPDFVLEVVLSFLPPVQRGRAREVCRRWRRVASSPVLWCDEPFCVIGHRRVIPEYRASVLRELIVESCDWFHAEVVLPRLGELQTLHHSATLSVLSKRVLRLFPPSCTSLTMVTVLELGVLPDFLASPRAANLRRCDVRICGADPTPLRVLPPNLEALTVSARAPLLFDASTLTELTICGSVKAGEVFRLDTAKFAHLETLHLCEMQEQFVPILAVVMDMPRLRNLKFTRCNFAELDEIDREAIGCVLRDPPADRMLETIRFEECNTPDALIVEALLSGSKVKL